MRCALHAKTLPEVGGLQSGGQTRVWVGRENVPEHMPLACRHVSRQEKQAQANYAKIQRRVQETKKWKQRKERKEWEKRKKEPKGEVRS